MNKIIIGKAEIHVEKGKFNSVDEAFLQTVRHLSRIKNIDSKAQVLQEIFVEVMTRFKYKQATHYMNLISVFFDSMPEVLEKLNFLLDLSHQKIEIDEIH